MPYPTPADPAWVARRNESRRRLHIACVRRLPEKEIDALRQKHAQVMNERPRSPAEKSQREEMLRLLREELETAESALHRIRERLVNI